MKNIEYECPKCGELEEIYNSSDPEFDVATDEMGHTYDFVTIERKCGKCDHRWTEYMRLVYDGYYTEGRLYNKDGQIERTDEV